MPVPVARTHRWCHTVVQCWSRSPRGKNTPQNKHPSKQLMRDQSRFQTHHPDRAQQTHGRRRKPQFQSYWQVRGIVLHFVESSAFLHRSRQHWHASSSCLTRNRSQRSVQRDVQLSSLSFEFSMSHTAKRIVSRGYQQRGGRSRRTVVLRSTARLGPGQL